jgi:hypothetical protein
MSLRLSFSPPKNPPVPIVTLDLVVLDGSETVAGVVGIVDTAADRTVIPLSFLHQLEIATCRPQSRASRPLHVKLRPVAHGRAQGFGTAAFVVDIYHLRVVIPNVCDVTVQAIEHANEPHILVGRDVLNQLSFTFDGPNAFIEFP